MVNRSIKIVIHQLNKMHDYSQFTDVSFQFMWQLAGDSVFTCTSCSLYIIVLGSSYTNNSSLLISIIQNELIHI